MHGSVSVAKKGHAILDERITPWMQIAQLLAEQDKDKATLPTFPSSSPKSIVSSGET